MIFGKINDLHLFDAEKMNCGRYRTLTVDEVSEKHMDLEKICVDSIWQKYIPNIK